MEVEAFAVVETGGEVAAVVAVPEVAVPVMVVNSNLNRLSQAPGNIKGPSTQTYPQEIGADARCISDGAARRTFVQNPRPVRGEMFLHRNRIKIEGPTSLDRIMLQSTQ